MGEAAYMEANPKSPTYVVVSLGYSVSHKPPPLSVVIRVEA
jgi:hypothetical protein